MSPEAFSASMETLVLFWQAFRALTKAVAGLSETVFVLQQVRCVSSERFRALTKALVGLSETVFVFQQVDAYHPNAFEH